MTWAPTADRWQRVRRLFEAAIERPVSERSAFVSAAVAGDETLRGEVEAMLAADAAGAALSEQWPVASESLLAELRIAFSTVRVGSASSPGLTAGNRVGNYDVVAPLGAGGMGEVYRAHDARLGRDVAIKILPHAFTTHPERLARFEREARVLAALNHPHIGGIYGIEEAGTAPALVLELVEGVTLADHLKEGRPDIEEALTIARQVADALSAAHDKGIVHRDLKPANVKITPAGVVKVLDFGLAKADGDGATPELAHSPTITVTATRDGRLLGTAAYMSPEQARGKTVDKRSDIWAFGCVLYETLSGRTPEMLTIGPSTARITSATEMSLGSTASRHPPDCPRWLDSTPARRRSARMPCRKPCGMPCARLSSSADTTEGSLATHRWVISIRARNA